MPKIDENKIADILNSLLTESINRGENLVKNLEKSASEFSKTLDSLDKKVTARAVEVQELVKAVKSHKIPDNLYMRFDRYNYFGFVFLVFNKCDYL